MINLGGGPHLFKVKITIFLVEGGRKWPYS